MNLYVLFVYFVRNDELSIGTQSKKNNKEEKIERLKNKISIYII